MVIDDLKNTWKSAGKSSKTTSELSLMTELNHNGRLKRIRRRLLIESIFVLAFLILFYTGLDGADKPVWTIVILVSSGVVYIINRLVGYKTTQIIKPDTDVYKMSQELIKKLERLSVSSGLSALFFGGAVILFMTIEIDFNTQKYTVLAGLIVSLFVFSFLSYSIWKKQISRLQQIIHQLSGDS